MVQPVAASFSCIQSFSPCSLISDLIQRVAECVAAIFNTIAGLFSSCFGQETAIPVVTIIAAPIAAPDLPTLGRPLIPCKWWLPITTWTRMPTAPLWKMGRGFFWMSLGFYNRQIPSTMKGFSPDWKRVLHQM